MYECEDKSWFGTHTCFTGVLIMDDANGGDLRVVIDSEFDRETKKKLAEAYKLLLARAPNASELGAVGVQTASRRSISRQFTEERYE